MRNDDKFGALGATNIEIFKRALPLLLLIAGRGLFLSSISYFAAPTVNKVIDR